MQTRIPYQQPRLSEHELSVLRERAMVTEDATLARLIQRVEFLETLIDHMGAQS